MLVICCGNDTRFNNMVIFIYSLRANINDLFPSASWFSFCATLGLQVSVSGRKIGAN